MMTGTYFIYYGLVILCIILAYAEVRCTGRIKYIWLLALVTLYSLVIGFKYSVGSDFQAYLQHYQRVYDGNEYETYFDEGYLILNRVLAFFRVPPVYFFVFLSFINFSAVVFIAKKTYPKALPWAVAVFIMMDYGMSLSTNIYRQYVALSCLTFILPLLLLKKKYFFLFFIGWFIVGKFHASAYIGLIYFFLLDKTILKYNNRILILLSIGLLYSFGSLVMPVFLSVFQSTANLIGMGDREYLDGYFRVELGSGGGVILKFFQSAVAIWLFPQIKNVNNDKSASRLMNLVFNGYLFGCFIKPLFYTEIVLLRTLAPFIMFEYIVIGWTIYYCLSYKRYTVIGLVLLLTYIYLFYLYIAGSINWMSPYIPFPNNYG